MIASLHGMLVEKSPNRVVVEVSGVGYAVHVPLSTFYVLGDRGSMVSLRIYTHVREDALALFGFDSAIELDLFERLIGISGIGPKLALAVLSGIEPVELVKAIRLQDVARLTSIPGIGKKTAERIGLEMKDRLPAAIQQAVSAAATASPPDQLHDDLLSALMNLGYQRQPAEKALGAVLDETPDASFESALKATLRRLMKS
jgi:Holliday junction DNA helicase RuvA